MTARRRLAVGAACASLAVLLGLLANWMLSPLTVSPETLERDLVDCALSWYAAQEAPHADEICHVGALAGEEVRDFRDEDMAFWRGRGHPVRPASAVEPHGLGQVRDRTTRKPAYVVLVKGHAWTGRNAVDVDLVLRSGFCANGVTLGMAHSLWGWRVTDSRPFHDF